MEQPTTDKEKPIKGKSLLDKIKDHSDEELHVLATFVRLGVVVWSGFIITLNYVKLPMIEKTNNSSDITFVASIFTGALATFGLNTNNKSNGNGNGNSNNSKKKEDPHP
jgi:hypothetical protein